MLYYKILFICYETVINPLNNSKINSTLYFYIHFSRFKFNPCDYVSVSRDAHPVVEEEQSSAELQISFSCTGKYFKFVSSHANRLI